MIIIDHVLLGGTLTATDHNFKQTVSPECYLGELLPVEKIIQGYLLSPTTQTTGNTYRTKR